MDPFARGDRRDPDPEERAGETPPHPVGPQESAPPPATDPAPAEGSWFTAGSSEERTNGGATPGGVPAADEAGSQPHARGGYGGYDAVPGLGDPPAGWTATPSGGYPTPDYRASSTHGTWDRSSAPYPPSHPTYGGYGQQTYWQGAPPPPRPARRRSSGCLVALAVVIGAVLLVVTIGGGVGAALLVRNRTQPQAQAPSNTHRHRSTGAIDLKTLAAKLDPGIVDITGVVQDASGQTVEEDAGTGVVITSDGDVLTNNHVIEGDDQLQATLANGDTDSLKVLGEDPADDVALVKIQGVSGLPTIDIAGGATASMDQAVAAFGNALGKGGPPSASQGVVTDLDQTITATLDDGTGKGETLTGMIEMSAQICPGDSGGVLANQQGQYLGILTAASSGSGSGGGSGGSGGSGPGYGGSGGSGGSGSGSGSDECSNDGFVIPAAHALAVVRQIRSGQATAKVIIGVPGFLGVEVQECTAASSQSGTCQAPQVGGAQVTQLVQGGAAQQAGLPSSFVITAINGTSVTDPTDLTTVLQKTTPGQSVQVTWNDGQGGVSQTTAVTLGSGPPA